MSDREKELCKLVNDYQAARLEETNAFFAQANAASNFQKTCRVCEAMRQKLQEFVGRNVPRKLVTLNGGGSAVVEYNEGYKEAKVIFFDSAGSEV